jgi:cytochrome P450
LSATVLYICSNVEVQAKLRRELHDAGLNPKRPTSSIVSNADAKRLPYVEACIKEGLRIHPPIIGLTDKIPGPEGDTLPDGRYIPPETHVGYCAWGLRRNPAVYGKDASVFRPERWLEHENEEDKWAKERNLELVFSYGRFTCMGKDIALMELTKCLAEV